jgi:hypothetical protein
MSKIVGQEVAEGGKGERGMLSCLDIFLKTNRWSLQSGGNTDINLAKLEWITREALVQDKRMYKFIDNQIDD